MNIIPREKKKILSVSVAILVAALLPLFTQNTAHAYVIRIVALAGLYMIVALGLNIVVGFLGLLDLGFMAFYAIGAYAMVFMAKGGWGFWPSILLCALITMAFRFLLGAPVLRLRGDYLAIVTLGFGEITRIMLNNWDSVTEGPKGISLLTDPDVKPVTFFKWALYSNTHYYYLILACVLLCVIISWRLLHSRIGRAWLAVREDETAARLTGIELTRTKMIGFVASAAFAGVAGGIFARWEGFITPVSFTFWESALLVTMVVIGGMGSIPGVLLGVGVVIVVPEVLRNVLGPGFVNWRYLLFGLALVLVAIYRPQGLWPSQVRRRDLKLEEGNGENGA